jgi:hypothetical protein
VPSARRVPQLAILALCGALGASSLAGCETTQEKAAAQRAESAQILKARASRRAAKKKDKRNQDNPHKHEKGKR